MGRDERNKKLIRESFELSCKRRWLKTIDRQVDKYNKSAARANREKLVVNKLIERYNELYPEQQINR